MEWHFYGSFQFVSKSKVADAEIKKKSIPLFLLFQSLTFSRPHVGNENLKAFFLDSFFSLCLEDVIWCL